MIETKRSIVDTAVAHHGGGHELKRRIVRKRLSTRNVNEDLKKKRRIAETTTGHTRTW